LAWRLFLADRPFRLGHLEISFGICSRLDKSPSRATVDKNRAPGKERL
jgi:hypothetical protein